MKVTFWPNGNGEALVYSLLLSMLLIPTLQYAMSFFLYILLKVENFQTSFALLA